MDTPFSSPWTVCFCNLQEEPSGEISQNAAGCQRVIWEQEHEQFRTHLQANLYSTNLQRKWQPCGWGALLLNHVFWFADTAAAIPAKGSYSLGNSIWGPGSMFPTLLHFWMQGQLTPGDLQSADMFWAPPAVPPGATV